MVLQIGDAGNGNGALDPVVDSRDPPAIRPAAAAAGDAEAVGVDLLARLEVVERADAVPRLDAGRRVAARVPPPHLLAVRAVVDAGNLAKLERVEHEAHVAVAGEPGGVVLVGGLVAVADVPFFHRRVPADVQNGRGGLVEAFREVQVAGDVQVRARLEVQVLDDKGRVVELAGDGGVKVRALGQRVETEHFEHLRAQALPLSVPILGGLNVREAGLL